VYQLGPGSKPEITTHALAVEVVSALSGEEGRHIADDFHLDAVVWCRVSKDLIDIFLGDWIAIANFIILQKASDHQSTHRMADEINFEIYFRRDISCLVA